MPRRRRYIESGALYEICIRARSGMPFPCRKLLTILIKSALARTQRDFKVLLSHLVWMGNHAHLLIIAKDATQLIRFYGELQKRITDSLKRLLGKRYLDLWEGAPSVIRIADLEAAIERIAYFYANPAKAGLVDSIEAYPGYSSWDAFSKGVSTLKARFVEEVEWVKAPSVPKAPRLELSEVQEDTICQTITKGANVKHKIRVFPNLWLTCFGVREKDEIQEINSRIVEKLKNLERVYAEDRAKHSMQAVGAKRLKRQALWVSHTPKRKDRRIFVIARSKEVRISYIKLVEHISKLCTHCYQAWKRGVRLEWPPGTFPPPIPMYANALA